MRWLRSTYSTPVRMDHVFDLESGRGVTSGPEMSGENRLRMRREAGMRKKVADPRARESFSSRRQIEYLEKGLPRK